MTRLGAILLAVAIASPALVQAEEVKRPEHRCPVGASSDVLVFGYWPPTNEMLRPFSKNPQQNPEGWQGRNWRGLGFDIYSYFPEFPPDGDPTNDEIGDPGSAGSGDLPVDFQDTSADFWRLVEQHRPVVLISTSRGGSIPWELEAVEGGHGLNNDGDASADWRSDASGDETLPTVESVDARSWAAMNRYRQGQRLASTLPLAILERELQGLTAQAVVIDQNTSGNYLSGFMGLHSTHYRATRDDVYVAGHIHVGRAVPVSDARRLIDETLAIVLREYRQDCL